MKWRVNSIRNLKRCLTSFALVFVLLLSFVMPTVASTGTVNYLALGDSLAAGTTPTGSSEPADKGYSDFTADYLKEKKLLANYSKLAVPGATTNQVLEGITSNEQVKEAIKNSNTITISAGANDLLSKVDLSKNPLTIDMNLIYSTLSSIGKNYEEILSEIKAINPTAKVYIMGYYFAFPYFPDAQKPQLIQLTKALNNSLQVAATSKGATFVSVYDQFGQDAKEYLPNPSNIHPNIDGYKKMSEVLLGIMVNNKPVANDIPKGFWAENELNLLLTSGVLQLDEKGNVYPGKAMTRAEVAKVLYERILTTKSDVIDPGFKDVPVTHPAYSAIAKLTEAGVFAKAENFNPDAPITRVQMAKVISIAFQLKSDGSVASYKDINAKYWGTPFISAISSNKIMMGYANGAFGIDDKTTRAQFAVILVRVQTNLVSQ